MQTIHISGRVGGVANTICSEGWNLQQEQVQMQRQVQDNQQWARCTNCLCSLQITGTGSKSVTESHSTKSRLKKVPALSPCLEGHDNAGMHILQPQDHCVLGNGRHSRCWSRINTISLEASHVRAPTGQWALSSDPRSNPFSSRQFLEYNVKATSIPVRNVGDRKCWTQLMNSLNDTSNAGWRYLGAWPQLVCNQ